jgi:hypothetical protein
VRVETIDAGLPGALARLHPDDRVVERLGGLALGGAGKDGPSRRVGERGASGAMNFAALAD